MPFAISHPKGADYEAVIGLEVHVQLQTASKAFSPESALFGADPNSQVDPVSLGHPGTLPVLNQAVVRDAIRLGLATNCQIRPRSVLSRKHYFYPDLPKGYQISQYEDPICFGGHLVIKVDEEENDRTIGITRIHMEEDAGKLIHDMDPYASMVDLNRCGVPLLELVSEPDMRSPQEAGAFLRSIWQTVRYLEICDGNMEEGSMRCDANVSIRKVGETILGTKTELKNMNSFRNVERALDYELTRQVRAVEAGEKITQQTLLWDADNLRTRVMRSKESAPDYRYFPDPDLTQVVVSQSDLDEAKASLPEMAPARCARFVSEYALPEYDAALLTEDKHLADYFESAVRAAGGSVDGSAAKTISNLVMTSVLRVVKEQSLDLASFPISPDRLAGLAGLRLAAKVNSSAMDDLFVAMLTDPAEAADLAESRNLLQVSDAGELIPVVQKVLQDNPSQLKEYKTGKQGLIGFFIGQVMRSYPGSPDPKVVREILTSEINRTEESE